MTIQIVGVDDAAPGACSDTGLTYNGSTTFTSTKIIAGTSMTMSGTVAVTGNVTMGGTVGITGDVAVNTDKFKITAASGNTVIDGRLGVGGDISLAGTATFSSTAVHLHGVGFGAYERSPADGALAIPITKGYQGYTTNSTAPIAATLADGIVGQRIRIDLTEKDTNNMVITPANLTGGTTITFDATGEYVELMFVGTSWKVLYTNATVA